MAKTSALGARIKALRLKKKMTQRDLAYFADLEHANISRYEAGKKLPTLVTLDRLARALGTTPSKLLAA
jgi:transcriptional regulator with XRE-family HTH domain